MNFCPAQLPLNSPAMWRRLLTVLAVLVLASSLLPLEAHAAAIEVPFIRDFGCSVVQWLKGPLAVLIFVIVCVVTFVMGMITKMDWGRIITVCILFGVLIGLGSIFSNSSYIQNVAGMSACLQ
jgi:type IV secretory pathway VirB2 component (pilin)